MRLVFLVPVFCCLLALSPLRAQTLATRSVMGEAYARERIEEAVRHPQHVYQDSDVLLKDASLAIATVEPLLFATYGKRDIVRQRPYEVYLLNGYWYIAGTIPKGSKGGGFEIILSADNRQILSLTASK